MDHQEANVKRRCFRWAALGLQAALALVILAAQPASGQAVRASVPEAAPDAVVVTVGSGGDFASIREAVAELPAGGVLRLADEVFTEGGIVLDRDLFLIGAGAGRTIVQASESLETAVDRVFTIGEGATVVLRDISMRHGHPQGECPRGGGAIANFGILWLDRCVVERNIGQCGGGLMNRDGDVYAYDCMFVENQSDGGLNMMGVQGMGSGGGIKNVKGHMVLDGCTIANNIARKKGGAIKNCCLGTLTMINCTVSGNRCASGGVHLNGPALIDHCTIAFNTAPFSLGAGIFVNSASVVRNSIIAGNTRGDVTVEVEEEGALAEFVNVWIGDGRTGIGSYAGDPLLGPLGAHGGPTWTHPLLSGSPAIDAGIFEPDGPSLDQRGVSRPVGATSDLGAFEVQPTDIEDRPAEP